MMPLLGKTTGANLIRILNSQNKLPAGFLGKQVIEQRRPQTTQMQKPRWARCEPRSCGRIVYGGGGIYRCGVAAAPDPCGAGGAHSSQEGIHGSGGEEGEGKGEGGGVFIGGGLIGGVLLVGAPGGRVVGRFAAVWRERLC